MDKAYVYKNSRRVRQASVETDFSSGMFYSSSPLEEGYVKTLVNFSLAEDGKTLVPRAGLRTTEFVFPDIYTDLEDDFYSSDVCIKAMKECIEDGESYVQCILGKPDAENDTKGKIWVATFKKKVNQNVETQFTVDGETFECTFSDSLVYTQSLTCAYYNTDIQEIHRCRLQEDSRIGFPVGTFAFNNSYYFFAYIEENGEQVKRLYKTTWIKPTFRRGYYVFEAVDNKSITASEAVHFGYNMLSENPYAFQNSITGSKIVLEGILPYESTADDASLVMTPKENQRLNYRCYYTAPEQGNYKFIWEWRTVDTDTWNFIDSEIFTVSADRPSSVSFVAPTANIMIRVRAYNTAAEDASSNDPIVEHAMVVGFDFTLDKHGTITNVVQKNYNLGDATGMTVWKNRLVLWGIQEDPTIMFLSDMNEPGYFPYPNNITVFDEPVISVLDFMDKLIVFTISKCYEVSLTDDGNSWTSTVIQANLHITKWDKHLIQTVRNMIYFKSGNYYYMLVPKATSTTGELTLAPISNPVTEFFNNFMVNVEQLFKDTYGDITSDTAITYDLITYYNFLDYEDVHNIYVFRWTGANTLIHFDVVYNTVKRYWRINVLEEPNLLYTYKNDATQPGVYASTSVLTINDGGNESVKRIVQLYKYDPLYIRDFFVPEDMTLYREVDEGFEGCSIQGSTLIIPAEVSHVFNDTLYIDVIVVDEFSDDTLSLLGKYDYTDGFKIQALLVGIRGVLENYDHYFKYRNYQFLDTGYRADATQYYKRYREIQLHINNLDNRDLSFGSEVYIDGDIRKSDYKYEVTQVINEMSENGYTFYLEPMMFLDVPVNTIDRTNLWTLEHSLNSELSLWKIRMQVSGKGTAPRLKLSSRNDVRYQFLGLNWVYRIMNMR